MDENLKKNFLKGKRRRLKRSMGILLAAAMIFNMLPLGGLPVSASENGGTGICEHHTEHTEGCGYAEERDCRHEHSQECYTAEGEPDCHHEHDEDCGYAKAHECAYVCELCNSETSGEDGVEEDEAEIPEENPDNENKEDIEDTENTENTENAEKCICKELCTEGNIRKDCPVCGAGDADLLGCKGKEPEDTENMETEDGDFGDVNPEDSGLCDHHKEHDGDCGYSPASEDGEGSPCTYQCRICPIEDLIAALPDEVTEDNAETVQAQLEEILFLYAELTEDEQEQIDLTLVYKLQEALDDANAPRLADGGHTERRTEDEASVEINEEILYYATLAEAFEAANGKSAIITMLKNVECISNDPDILAPLAITSGAVILKMDGNTLSGYGYGIKGLIGVGGGSLTIQGGTVEVAVIGIKCDAGTLMVSDMEFDLVGFPQYNNTPACCAIYNATNGRVTIDSGSFVGPATDGHIRHSSTRGSTTINDMTSTGTTNENPRGVWKENAGTLKINGGTFDNITIDNAERDGVAGLLGDKYTYRYTNGTWATDTDMSEQSIENVSVQKIPLTISPTTDTSWYYNSGVHILQMNAVPATADKAVTYEWYEEDNELPCTEDAYSPDAMMPAGNYKYTCKAICDGYILSHEFVVDIKQSGTTFEGSVKTYNGDKETDTFSAGDIITVKAMPKATGAAPKKAARSVLGRPAAGQMAAYYGDIQISEPSTVENGVHTMTIDTQHLPEGAVNKEIAITVKYMESANMAGAEAQANVTVGASVQVATDSDITYFGTFEDAWNEALSAKKATITLLDDVTIDKAMAMSEEGIDIVLEGKNHTLSCDRTGRIQADQGILLIRNCMIDGYAARTLYVNVNTNTTVTLVNTTVKNTGMTPAVEVQVSRYFTMDADSKIIGITSFKSSSQQLTAGTFSSASTASPILCKDITLGNLLKNYGVEADTHYAYFDAKGAPILDVLKLTEFPEGYDTVTIGVCAEHVFAYEHEDGTEKHSKVCRACGYTAVEDCDYGDDYDYDYNNDTHTQTCTFCGNKKTEAHEITYSSEMSGNVITFHTECNACQFEKELGTMTVHMPDDLTYGETKGKTVTCETAISYEKIGIILDGKEESFSASYILPELSVGKHTLKICVYVAGAADPLVNVIDFQVDRAPLLAEMVTLSKTSVTYNGNEQQPVITALQGAKTLIEGTDYEVAYSRNDFTNVGTVNITVSGIGNYEGTVRKTFTIEKAVPAIAWAAGAAQEMTYMGQSAGITALPVVTLENGEVFTGTIHYSYRKEGESAYTKGLPADAGIYEIKAGIDAQGNYAAAESSNTLKLTISYMEAPAQLLYNGESKKECYKREDVAVSAAGYQVSDAIGGTYKDSFVVSPQEGTVTKVLYFKNASGHISDGVTVTLKFDLTPPTGSISVGAKWWQNALNFISFGHYTVKEYAVTIKAEDAGGSGIGKIWAAVVEGDTQYNDADELANAAVDWKEYTGSFTVPADSSKYAVYAKLTDNAGNVTYISTDGILLDETAPTVAGLTIPEDTVGTQTAAITFTVDEAADYYYVVLPKDAAAPSAKDIIATCDLSAPAGTGGSAVSGSAASGSGQVSEDQVVNGKADINVIVSDLTPGKAYIVYITAVDKTADITNLAEGKPAGNIAEVEKTDFTMKKITPAAPTLSYTRTADEQTGLISLAITAVEGAEYSFDGGQTWESANEQGGFDPSQKVTIAIRMKETDTHNPSAMQSAEVDLAKKDREAPPAFTLKYEANGETDYTVTMPASAGCEYSFDGATWSESNVKTGVKVGETVTGYMRYKENEEYNASGAVSASVTLPMFTVKAPEITPAGGSYTGSISVTITCGSADAEIYYTVDGSMPGRSSIRYTGAFTLTPPATVKAIAVKEGFIDSAVIATAYTKKDSGSSSGGSSLGGSSSGGNGSGGSSGEDSDTGNSSAGSTAGNNISNPSAAPSSAATAAEAGQSQKTGAAIPADGKTQKTGTAQSQTQSGREPFIKGADGKIGWDVIRAEEEKTEDGNSINVDMNGTTLVPGDIFDRIKGRDITITFDLGSGILWSVDGKSVTRNEAGDKAGDIDFSVKTGVSVIPVDIVNNITGESGSIQLSLAHNGEFGFTAVLSINLGKENAGYTANLYYYDQRTGELEFMCADEVAEDGMTSLTFTHASDYLITIDDTSKESESEDDGSIEEAPETSAEEEGNGKEVVTSPKEIEGTEGSSLPWLILTGAAVVILGVAGIVIWNRKKKEE